jgi:thymidylate kinase
VSRIIVLEGADRCGKNTQAKMLTDHIRSIGKTTALVEVPVEDSYTHSVIYWMLQSGAAKKLPKIFQWLQCLNRLIFQTYRLVKLEHENDFIVFDRWSLSSAVYGKAEGLPSSLTDKIYCLVRKPDFTVLFIGERLTSETEDVYEADDKLQERVRTLYAEWADSHPKESYVVIDTKRSREQISNEINIILKISRILPT